MLCSLNTKFDIIAISESKIKDLKTCINKVELPNYQIEFTAPKSLKGGTLLYISNNHTYKVRKDLIIYKEKELESTFIEIINLNKNAKNIIVGCIYKHPKMSVSEFSDIYMREIFHKISFENKNVMLLGDYNIDLIKCDTHKETMHF